MRMTTKLTSLGLLTVGPLVVAVSALAAQAQTSSEAPTTAPPAESQQAPQNAPADAAPQASPDATPPQAESTQGAAEDSAAVTTATSGMVGMPVVAADGTEVGEVTEVKATQEGTVKEIHVETGGFLGFGTRTVIVPVGKFIETQKDVKLTMAAEELEKLPLATPQG